MRAQVATGRVVKAVESKHVGEDLVLGARLKERLPLPDSLLALVAAVDPIHSTIQDGLLQSSGTHTIVDANIWFDILIRHIYIINLRLL
jgi:hypothetical protein